MTHSARIFIGDLVRALAMAGGPGGEDWDRIAAMLGFGRAPFIPSREPSPPQVAAPGAETQAGAPKQAAPAQAPSTETAAGDVGDPIEFETERRAAPPSPVPPPAPLPEQRRGPGLRLAPLFDPLWERGILIEAVGRQLAEGEIAVGAAVHAIARGDPLAEAPREWIMSVGKGCQVLIDTGPGMRPFARDCHALAAAVRHAAGAEHTRVLTFVDCPSNGVLNESYEDETYRPPENGAMVLAVSDLCSGGPGSAIRQARPRDWLAVFRAVRDAGSALVILNPYPARNWPLDLCGRFPIIPWDRGIRASDVRQARRRNR